jgi:hypothetical protein
MKNLTDLLQGYYGYVNKNVTLKTNKNLSLVETHVCDCNDNWEVAEWYLLKNGESVNDENPIAICDGYNGVKMTDLSVLALTENEIQEITELVTPYELEDLCLAEQASLRIEAENSDTDVLIEVTKNYYTSEIDAESKNQPRILKEDDGETDRIFPTFIDAQEWIDEQENSVYVLSNGEVSRPEYRIVRSTY